MERRKIERNMTIGYVVGLLFIGFWATGSTFILYKVIEQEVDASKTYDLISSQQNIIQGIALISIALTEGPSQGTRKHLLNQLSNKTAQLMTNHLRLSSELAEKAKFRWKLKTPSANLAEQDRETYASLDREIKTFVASANYLASLKDPPQDKKDISVKVLIDRAGSALTGMLSDLHLQYRQSHHAKQALYKKIQIASLATILLVLILEGLFLFRPMVNIVRREHDEIIEAMIKADRANEVKSQFLANVSHEIRTPLTAIIGFSEMTLADSSLSANARNHNATIKRSALYLKSLIDDLLDMTKAEENRLDIQNQRINFDTLLHEVVSILMVRANERNIQLRIFYENPIPETFESDPLRIKQVLFNVVGNAIKFTERGQVTVRAKFRSGEEILTLQVEDTGVGIAPANQTKLFTRFFQADSSMTRRETGSGIGLSLSKVICQGLGGDLRLVASNDRGSLFEVSLPTHKPSPEVIDSFQVLGHRSSQDLTLETIANSLSEVSVLLVEDGEENRRIYTYFLEMAGAKVTLALNGREGVEKASKDHFDVILMDIQMPVMDGYEAARHLLNVNLKTPIIALTAHALKAEREKCLAMGFSAYLPKPVEIPQLLQAVAEWSGHSSPREGMITAVKKGDALGQSNEALRSTFHHETAFEPLLKEFTQILPERLNTIKEAGNEKNWDQLARVAHKIKGAAATYGYPSLSDQAGDLELSAKRLLKSPSLISDEKVEGKILAIEHLCRRIVAGGQKAE